MKNLGDITKLNGAEIPVVDIITGGSPCQNLSQAGNRKGLEGDESKLFFEQIRIIKEMREHDRSTGRTGFLVRPRYAVWENVQGALTSNKGADFQKVLTEFVRIAEPESPDVPMPQDGKWSHAGCLYDELGRWSVAWRLHDAQFWGVPQRRKRIALVADFGGLSAPEVLFESQGMRWDSSESGEEEEGTASRTESGSVSAVSIKERAGKPGGGKGLLIQNERAGSLATSNNQAVCYSIGNYTSGGMLSPNPHSGIYETEQSRTIDQMGASPSCNQGGTAIVTNGE